MGSSMWSNDFYEDRQSARKATQTPIFKHTDDVQRGRVATAIHEALDPAKIKNGVRESRDSKEHPESLPILFLLDVTGSMAEVPRVVQGALPKLMSTILTNGYTKDPQILFGAIGDAHSDRAPLQIGQFESGIEMDDDLTRVFLEGNGGGQNHESYELGFYFAAKMTSTDAWEKRQKKGYLFITGDEHPYSHATRSDIRRVFDRAEEADIPVETLVKACQERYHVFFIIPSRTSNGSDPRLRTAWEELLGADAILNMPDASKVCDLVARKIGECEGTLLPDGAAPAAKASDATSAKSAAATKIDDAKSKGKKTARL